MSQSNTQYIIAKLIELSKKYYAQITENFSSNKVYQGIEI